MFQFTRPQGARHTSIKRHIETITVSIHAPARGATCVTADITYQQGWFQFTRPQGARHLRRPAELHSAEVSIHAPARGATRTRSIGTCSSMFQFTRPQGARQRKVFGMEVHKRFNSRARKGRDFISRIAAADKPVSIHAPARGATPRLPGHSLVASFQFTRPQGARRVLPNRPRSSVVFQFTRPQGARPRPADLAGRSEVVSIHAPARGATCACCLSEARPPGFNSRARKGRDDCR